MTETNFSQEFESSEVDLEGCSTFRADRGFKTKVKPELDTSRVVVSAWISLVAADLLSM